MRFSLITLVAVLAALPALAETAIKVTYLRELAPPRAVLSNLDPVPEDLGVAGARLGTADNMTTGRFLGQSYALAEIDVETGGDVLAAARAALAESPYLILDAPDETLLAIADMPEAQGALLFDVSSGSDDLRETECRTNLLHTAPTLSMRSDALMQFLQSRRWTDLAMISGSRAADVDFADALRRSAKKFNLRIRGEKVWAFDADMRRSAAQELPVFLQDLRDHDVLVVADETDDFARYVPYNSWIPRPVAGSEGLTPVGWSPVMEQWGAAQLQSRFEAAAGRDMSPKDYAAWVALRSIGEAAARTQACDPATLRAYMLSADFALDGFKGRPLSYRDWNGQLRQPIAVTAPRAVVAMAPLDGFLHPVSELDTLGLDRPETLCTAFTE
ncbi:MAG: ABC transporter substrate-binding protein [Rhodobacteraceae bacterium]|nr:ABC transporter substrate-binding protein [Paracoccaceae bacterium]